MNISNINVNKYSISRMFDAENMYMKFQSISASTYGLAENGKHCSMTLQKTRVYTSLDLSFVSHRQVTHFLHGLRSLTDSSV